jgi:hypothetical protein
MKSYGGQDNSERSGDFDKENTVSRERAAHNRDQEAYDRMMENHVSITDVKYPGIPKVRPQPPRRG